MYSAQMSDKVITWNKARNFNLFINLMMNIQIFLYIQLKTPKIRSLIIEAERGKLQSIHNLYHIQWGFTPFLIFGWKPKHQHTTKTCSLPINQPIIISGLLCTSIHSGNYKEMHQVVKVWTFLFKLSQFLTSNHECITEKPKTDSRSTKMPFVSSGHTKFK